MASERYQRQQKLGEGQMSAVWLARDTFTQDLVALKILTALSDNDRRNQKARERFHREIEIARSVQHPHILPLLDYGYTLYEKRRMPYLVSPYIPGGSLAALLRKRPPWLSWSLLQTVDIIMQAAESLHYLHTRVPPIVHADVKPGNFLCTPQEGAQRVAYIYLCDFGISRWVQSSYTKTGDLLGTFQYMAPEQFEYRVDVASDQYALAVTACYLLTGKLPIQASSRNLYPEAHLLSPPLSPSMLYPERIGSEQVDAVILRALEKLPDERFPSVLQFAEALRDAVAAYVQQEADATTLREDTSSAPTVVDDVPLLNPLSALPPLPSKTRTSEPSPFVPPPPVVDMSIALDPPETFRETLLDEPLPGRPHKVTLSTPTSNERTEASQAFTRLPWLEQERIELPARPRTLCWSPDGRAVACTLYGAAPLVLDMHSGVHEIEMPQGRQATTLCWSGDSRVLAVSMPGEIRFWDTLAQATLPLVLHFSSHAIDEFSWSIHDHLAVWMEDQVLVYSSLSSALVARRAPAPRRITPDALSCGNIGTLCWSTDGTLLAAGAKDGQVLCWHHERLAVPWQIVPAGQKVNSLCWSPENTLLLAAFRDKRVSGWDVERREELVHWEHLPSLPRMLSVSPQGYITVASSEPRLLLLQYPHSGPSNEQPGITHSSASPGYFSTPKRSSELVLDTRHASFPIHTLPGQLLAAWSPIGSQIATLDAQRQHVLCFWADPASNERSSV